MAGLFGSPSTPTIVQNTTPTVIDESKNKARTLEALRKKKGRASNMLVGDYYNANSTANNNNNIAGQAIATKQLLGQ